MAGTKPGHDEGRRSIVEKIALIPKALAFTVD
jgi:hypothetical protein